MYVYVYIYIYIYSEIRMKLKPDEVVIINLFRRRILLYSPSDQMTFYMPYLGLQNSKCGITVHICTKEKKIHDYSMV